VLVTGFPGLTGGTEERAGPECQPVLSIITKKGSRGSESAAKRVGANDVGIVIVGRRNVRGGSSRVPFLYSFLCNGARGRRRLRSERYE
jgi:hypothetical protein